MGKVLLNPSCSALTLPLHSPHTSPDYLVYEMQLPRQEHARKNGSIFDEKLQSVYCTDDTVWIGGQLLESKNGRGERGARTQRTSPDLERSIC